jgi:hypothetical protein
LSNAQPKLAFIFMFAFVEFAPAPVVDTQAHQEDCATERPAKQEDENEHLVASHWICLLS